LRAAAERFVPSRYGSFALKSFALFFFALVKTLSQQVDVVLFTS
jgi:hypothetical protein